MQIWDLFRGYDKAHGCYEMRRTTDGGKVQGKALTKREPCLQSDWDAHLAGTASGIGIIPLLADNTVVWGVIDVDQYDLDHSALEEKIKQLDLPLVMTRSKSGGAHLFVFMIEPVEAQKVVSALQSWAAALGHGGCEVFPKQTSRYDENDIGNWLNMPYYHADMTLRYGIKDGEQLDLNEFLEYAESCRLTEEQLDSVSGKGTHDPSLNEGLFFEGPPCLQLLFNIGGFPEGTRNDGMYNVAVYLRRRYPDDWEDKMQAYNVAICDPPLSLQEVSVLVKSVNKRDYAYRCRLPPIKTHCDKRLCQRRQFGVGEMVGGRNAPTIGHLVKHVGDPVLWFVEIDSHRIMVTTEDLLNQNRFKRFVADQMNRVIVSVAQARWDRYIDELMQNCDVIEVPEDASPLGQFKILVEQYAYGQAQVTTPEELAFRMSPYNNGEGEVWFRSRGLLDYLSTHGFRITSEHHVWQMLRKMGAENKFINSKGRGFNVWVIPSQDEQTDEPPLPDFGTEAF